MRKLLLWVVGLFGALMVIILALLVIMVIYVPGNSSDRILKKAASPDGRFVAEIHTVITPMWGGPDTVNVALRNASDASMDVVYSRTFECGDYGAFQLHWKSPQNLTVAYGTCEGSRYRSASDNLVSREVKTWRGINITYELSGYLAHGTP